jgi:hypothetical protein
MARTNQFALIAVVLPAVCLTFSQRGAAQSLEVSALGLGDAVTVSANKAFGSVQESVDITLPPNRLAPALSLDYGSLSSMLQSLGLGWSMEPGKIERSTEHGVPIVAQDDEFLFSLGASTSKLVSVGGNAYRAETETEYRTHARLGGGGWEVLDASGVRYLFGTSSAYRVDGPAPGGGDWTLIWLIERIQDTNGNIIAFSHEVHDNVPYVTEITLNGHGNGPTVGPTRVSFGYELRPDTRISYRLGLRQENRRRLASIAMEVDGAFVRRYVIDYAQSALNGRSLLSSVRMRGTTDSTALNVRDYGYTTGSVGWNPTAAATSLPLDFHDADGTDTGVLTGDVNGDGYADLLSAANGSRSVYLGDGSGGFNLSASWSAELDAVGFDFVDGDGAETGVRLLDLDGDGRPDLVRASPNPDTHLVYLNTGSGWAHSAGYSSSLAGISKVSVVERRFVDRALCDVQEGPDGAVPPPPPPECSDLIDNTERLFLVREDGDAPGIQFGDVNGDGRIDIVWNYATTSELFDLPSGDGSDINGRAPAVVRAVYLNTGGGWTENVELTEALVARTAPPPSPADPTNPDHYRLDFFTKDSKDLGYSLVDVNGDGLADIIRTHASFERGVFLNTGSDWLFDFAYSNSLAATSIVSARLDGDTPINEGLVPLDFNGDGLLDYVRGDESVIEAFRNTGGGWAFDAAMTANLSAVGMFEANADGELQGQKIADIDGDGASDLLRAREGLANAVFLSRSARVDLLAHATTARRHDAQLCVEHRFPARGHGRCAHVANHAACGHAIGAKRRARQ